MNRAFLDANMPVAISGADQVDSSVIFPSSVVAFEDPNTKVSPLLPQANLGGIFTAMDKVESSMEESSLSATSAGQLPASSQKATSVAIANKHAETLLKGVGKTLAEAVVQYGDLMKDIVIQHLVTPQVMEVTDNNVRLKYPTLTLQNKVINGKEMSKELRFDEALLGVEATKRERDDMSLQLLEEVGYPKNKKHIYSINPMLFSRFRYLTRVVPERMFPENEEYRQAIMSQIYAQFAENPYIELETLTRKTLYPYFRSETEELMKDTEMQQQEPQQEPVKPPQTTFGQQAQNRATDTALTGMGRVG
jgi:ribosomal protein S13